jgi:hypothetical protein
MTGSCFVAVRLFLVVLIPVLAGCGGSPGHDPLDAHGVEKALRGRDLGFRELGKVVAARCTSESTQWSCRVTTTTGRTTCTVGTDREGGIVGTYCGSLRPSAAERRKRTCARLKKVVERAVRKKLRETTGEFNSGSACITIPIRRRSTASTGVATPAADNPPAGIADFHIRFPYVQRWARTYHGQISSEEFPTSCRGDAALIVHDVTLARLSIPPRPCGTGWQPLALTFSPASRRRVLTRARRLHRNVVLYIRIRATVHRHPGDAHAWQGIVHLQ